MTSSTTQASGNPDPALLRGRTAVIIEDHRLFADFLHGCLQEWGFGGIEQATTGADGLRLVREKRPDLLLLDISLPDMDGLEVARVVLAECAEVKILGLSSHRDSWTMLQVQRLGLHGFVDKLDQSREVLRQAVETVLSGHVFYTRAVNESSARLRRDPKAFTRVLSDYETRLLALIGQAMTDEEIAAEVGISPATMQSRRRDIMRKLDIHTTPKLIHYAITQGLTRPGRFAQD